MKTTGIAIALALALAAAPAGAQQAETAPGFYSGLPMMPDARDLWEHIARYSPTVRTDARPIEERRTGGNRAQLYVDLDGAAAARALMRLPPYFATARALMHLCQTEYADAADPRRGNHPGEVAPDPKGTVGVLLGYAEPICLNHLPADSPVYRDPRTVAWLKEIARQLGTQPAAR